MISQPIIFFFIIKGLLELIYARTSNSREEMYSSWMGCLFLKFETLNENWLWILTGVSPLVISCEYLRIPEKEQEIQEIWKEKNE